MENFAALGHFQVHFAHSIIQSSPVFKKAMNAPDANSYSSQLENLPLSGSDQSNIAQEDPALAMISKVNQDDEEEDVYVSGSDLDTEDEDAPKTPRISERRRTQNKTFLSWFVFKIGNDSLFVFLTPLIGFLSEPNK